MERLLEKVSHKPATYFLMPHKVRSWLVSIFDKARPLFESDLQTCIGSIYEPTCAFVSRSQPGPALKIQFDTISQPFKKDILNVNGVSPGVNLFGSHLQMRELQASGFANFNAGEVTTIDVDLVPVFRCDPKNMTNIPIVLDPIQYIMNGPKWLEEKNIDYQKSLKESLKKDIHLVPVPLKKNPNGPGWRLEFKEAEFQLINGHGSLKKVLKILKYFRKIHITKMTKVKTYFLKTIIMHMVRDCPNKNWSEQNIAKDFIEALKHLQNAYEKKRLSSFFIEQKNIFENVKPSSFPVISDWLKETIENLESAPDHKCEIIWRKYFSDTNSTRNSANEAKMWLNRRQTRSVTAMLLPVQSVENHFQQSSSPMETNNSDEDSSESQSYPVCQSQLKSFINIQKTQQNLNY